jgi:type IV pilus modification protein PilV
VREHRHRLSSPRLRGEDGFTMVEIMVAMVLLVIGVLAMLVIVEGGLTSTSRTTAREQATNLARDLVERSRQVPYASTTLTAAPAALAAALPEAPTVSGGTFTVRRRNIDYTVTVTACSIDSPADGAGVGNATFCDAPTNSTGPGVPPSGSGLALGPNVLGIPVDLAVGGSLINTVCNALGTDTDILNAVTGTTSALLSLAGNGATLSACASAPNGQIAFDTRPDDLRRIRIKVDWTQASKPYSLTQTTLLTTPG